MVPPWERKQTDGRTDRQTDGRYQVHYLPCFAVDNKLSIAREIVKIFKIFLEKSACLYPYPIHENKLHFLFPVAHQIMLSTSNHLSEYNVYPQAVEALIPTHATTPLFLYKPIIIATHCSSCRITFTGSQEIGKLFQWVNFLVFGIPACKESWLTWLCVIVA